MELGNIICIKTFSKTLVTIFNFVLSTKRSLLPFIVLISIFRFFRLFPIGKNQSLLFFYLVLKVVVKIVNDFIAYQIYIFTTHMLVDSKLFSNCLHYASTRMVKVFVDFPLCRICLCVVLLRHTDCFACINNTFHVYVNSYVVF